MAKLKLAVLMGGNSTEHEVSLTSAQAILANLDKDKYDLIPLTITKDNRWLDQEGEEVSPIELPKLCDLVFPVLHGSYGEDGTLQGLLEVLNLPYVGCNVASSALCMDKVFQKDLCQAYQLPLVSYFWFSKGHWRTNQKIIISQLKKKFAGHFPLFVKPANSGSSIGVTKVSRVGELSSAIKIALMRDTKVIVEQGIDHAREIECSILGPNHAPKVSVLGEIIPHNEFYDYQTKYLKDTSKAVIPAKLPPKLVSSIQAAAKLAYKVLGCEGLARVDFLLDHEGKYFLNELNTMPGFTPISMYPKLWEASGLSFSHLLDRLIELAIIRHQERDKLNHSYTI